MFDNGGFFALFYFLPVKGQDLARTPCRLCGQLQEVCIAVVPGRVGIVPPVIRYSQSFQASSQGSGHLHRAPVVQMLSAIGRIL